MDEIRFGELYEIPSSNGLSRPSAVRGEGYKMVNMGELFANNIILDMEMERVKMSEKELQKFLLKDGDLLFARQSLVASGAGKCSIVKALSEETTFESHLIRVRLNNRVANPWYYYYLFQLPYNPVKTIVNQCAQAGIRGSELVNIKVPLLDLQKQTKIASILSAYDDLIENNKKRIKILEQMAENLYKEWFVRFRFPRYETAEFENGFPKGWEIRRLDKVSKLSAGGDAPKDFSLVQSKEYPIPIYSNGIVNDGLYGYCKKPTRTAKSITISARGTVGFVCLRFQPYMPIVRLVSIEPKNESLDVFYLYYYFKENSIEGYGTSQQQITIPYLSKKKILVPNINLMEKFGIYIDKLFENINDLKEKNKNLIKQRDLLLPRLMSGKLKVIK